MTIIPPPDRTPRPDLHKVVNGEEADRNCPTLRGFTGFDCPHCGRRYIIHCEKCEQQCSNCFPADTLITSPRIRASISRWWSGEMVVVNTALGKKLTGTPNHPVLTNRKWLPMQSLVESDYLVCASFGKDVFAGNPDIQNMPSMIGEIHDSLLKSGKLERRRGSGMDFHGDGFDGDVDVVWANSLLSNRTQPSFNEPVDHLLFPRTNKSSLCECPSMKLFVGSLHSTNRSMSGSGHRLSLFRSALSVSQQLGGRVVTKNHSGRNKPRLNSRPSKSKMLTQPELRFASEIHLDQIVGIDIVPFEGHVYNLSTETQSYTANGVVAHNCACTMDDVMTRAREEAARRAQEAEHPQVVKPWEKKLWTPGNN